MRHVWAVLSLALIAGCSSTDEPKPETPLSADEIPAMPALTMDEVLAKLKQPGGKARLILFWRADTEAASPCLAEADRLAAAHAEAGLEVLALNIDLPNDVRERALPLLQKAGVSSLQAHAYQDDVMGLGGTLDYTWGGQTPAAFLYNRKGKQVYSGHGKDAVAQAAAKVADALAGR